MKTLAIVFSIFCYSILYGCATHEDVMILDDRLTYLEQHYTQMSSNMDDYVKTTKESDQDMRSQYASLRAMRDRIEEELQGLNGRLEEVEHLLDNHLKASQGSEDLKKDVSSNTDKINQLAKYIGYELSETDVSPPPAPGGDNSSNPNDAVSKGTSEDELYLSAKQLFDKRDYKASMEEFQALLKKYPNSKNADNAQFWIAEIHYQEKWYEKAILEYQKVIEKYPKGNKVPAALLKQGMAFHELKDDVNAKTVFKDLIKRYPKSNEANIGKKKLDGLK